MKILIIEDDQSVAELERDYLEINGGFHATCIPTVPRGSRRRWQGTMPWSLWM